MITQYGMSEKFGLMALATVENQYLEGRAYMNCSDRTAAQADQEVQQMLQSCYADAKRMLAEHRGLLDEISLHLLNKETITGDELMSYLKAAEDASAQED